MAKKLHGIIVFYTIKGKFSSRTWICAYTKAEAIKMITDWLINKKELSIDDISIEGTKFHKPAYENRLSEEFYQKEIDLIYGGKKNG